MFTSMVQSSVKTIDLKEVNQTLTTDKFDFVPSSIFAKEKFD
jgi:hypothetical protein